MKRFFTYLVMMLLLVSAGLTVEAADDSRKYLFELSVDGSDSKEVKNGDIITVTFYLDRTDSEDAYDMYAMQNEIRYDSDFFELIENSALLSEGITTRDIGLRDNFREFYMNFLSISGGEKWTSRKLVGSFQLKVTAEAGVSKITNQDYLVSTADGKNHYAATAQDITIIVSSECTVSFDTNGGSAIEPQKVRYGEHIQRPDDPAREGYAFEGWYSDIDLQKLWNFEEDKVQGNMTLYAKWIRTEAESSETQVGTIEESKETTEQDVPVQSPDGENDGSSRDKSYCWLWWILLLVILIVVAWIIKRYREQKDSNH